MAFKLRCREIGPLPTTTTVSTTANAGRPGWEVELSTTTDTRHIVLLHPLHDLPPLATEPEKEIRWYFEKYISEPFETTRAESAARALSHYGRRLAQQLVESWLIPKGAVLELEILCREVVSDGEDNEGQRGRTSRVLEQLHWELLEDLSLWPPEYRLQSVSVIRTVHTNLESTTEIANEQQKTKFRILLVVSRPKQEADVDHQLVSRCLVAILNHISKTKSNLKVILNVLRPPTWQAFKDHLQENTYDLVHLDMHGEVLRKADSPPVAMLNFCKPDLLNPFKMKRDLRTGEEIGKELAGSGVTTVVLNACESASLEYAAPQSNLAQVLIRQGIQSVIAMSYKVVDEAVEIFMSAFYQNLLLNRATVKDALRVSRMALLDNRSRRARYMYHIDLSDYIIPTYYASAASSSTYCANAKPGAPTGIFAHIEKALDTLKQILPLKHEVQHSLAPEHVSFMGRDIDISCLELVLSASRLILLHGQGGCGKTELLHYISRWWEESGWIVGSAYIDFDARGIHSFKDILSSIGNQLGIEPNGHSEHNIVSKFASGKHLLVFDSVDNFDSPILLDNIIVAGDLPTKLKRFIEAIVSTESGSMVIVSSRLDDPKIANIRSERQKYHLLGLSILECVTLIQRLAFGTNVKPPLKFLRRENIDFLRRVAILLEGNPSAIQMIVPTLKKVDYDGEALLNILLYGVCEAESIEWERCRFVRSVGGTILNSFINYDSHLSSTQLGVFWTIVPENLKFYYWFFFLPGFSKWFNEGSYASWLTPDFHDIVNTQCMASTLDKDWPSIEAKFLKAGMLERASMIQRSGKKVSCYHVHPIFTLISRSGLNAYALKQAKYAYVRHIIISEKTFGSDNLIGVEWNNTRQHEDYLHNIRAMAMAWSLDDGDLQEEVERMGISLFRCTYITSIDSLYANARQSTLFIPHMWQQLLKVHMLASLLRPNGIPTKSDVDEIMTYSWALYRLLSDTDQKSNLISTALQAREQYRSANPSHTTVSPAEEFSLYQFRHAEAVLSESAGDIYRTKELFERNLGHDPSTATYDTSDMYNAIRRCQLQNLTSWAECVTVIAAREGRLKREQAALAMQPFVGDFRPGKIWNHITKLTAEHPEIWQKLTNRDQFLFALEQEPAAVKKFGKLTQDILNAPVIEIFADTMQGTKQPSSNMFDLIGQLLESNDPMSSEMRGLMSDMEAGLRIISGDSDGAALAMQTRLQLEALSSTKSSGREKIADLHMQLYSLAVQSDQPDYAKGLTHLKEWWKQHHGVGITKENICYGYLKFIRCYLALKQVAEASRYVIKCAEVISTMTDKDVGEDDTVIHFNDWLYRQFAILEELDIFSDPKVIFSTPPSATGLTWQERTLMHQIMKKAHEFQAEWKAAERAAQESRETLAKARELLKILGRGKDDEEFERRMERRDRDLKARDDPSRSWLG